MKSCIRNQRWEENLYNKKIKDNLGKIEDKSSETFKLQQGKLKVATQNLQNYKRQQSLKKSTEKK